jgi:hypothetical protein
MAIKKYFHVIASEANQSGFFFRIDMQIASSRRSSQ